MLIKRNWLGVGSSVVVGVVLSGCTTGVGTTVGAVTGTPKVSAVKGSVHGGQQPVSGATVTFWSVNATGAAATSLLGTSLTTDANGGFTVSTPITCPAGSQVYVTATGGNPGLGTGKSNPALALMAAVGPCTSLNSTTFLNVNEVTTVAAVWALQQFMGVVNGTAYAETIGVTGTTQSVTGMGNAFSTAQTLADYTTGAAGPVSGISNATVEIAKINTIANILASCVNSDGTTPCSTLFQLVSPTGSAAAADTIQAALYLAQNPIENLNTIYSLQGASPPFQPNLATAPFDWTLGVIYTGSGLNAPSQLAVDASGNVWVTNAASGTAAGLVELTPNGQAAAGSPFLTGAGTPLNGPQAVAIDTLGNIWNAESASATNSLVRYVPGTNTYSTLPAVSGCLPYGLTIDGSNNVFFTCSGLSSVYEYQNLGSTAVPVYGGSPSLVGATGSLPYGIAVDTKGNLWTANEGSSTVTELPAGSPGSPVTFSGNYSNPYSIAVDHSGNIWPASGSSYVTELLYSNSYFPTSFPGAGMVSPRGVAVDGAGYIWVANGAATTINSTNYVSISKESNTGGPLSPDATTTQPGGFAKATTATSPAPRGIAIDPSGNVWMAGCSASSNCGNGSSFVMELVGAAYPVVTPLSTAVGANQQGCCGNTSPTPGSVTINPAGQVSLGAGTYSPTQNSGSFAFAVYRESGSAGTASVQYSTSNGTAIAGTDYTAQSGTLTWSAGDQSIKTITVPWLDTSNYAGTKTFTVSLSNATGASMGSYPTTLVSVGDNLTPPYPTFNFVQPSTGCRCTWKIQLPVDQYGGNGGTNGSQYSSTEVQGSVLNTGFSDPYFYLNSSGYIVFTAPANGATTSPGSGSNHTRSELRELYTGTGTTSNSDWLNTTGGTLNATVQVTQVAPATNVVTIGQLHGDPATFVVLSWRTTNVVSVQIYPTPTSSSSTTTTVLSNVSLGDTISYTLQVTGTTLNVTVNDLTKSTSNTYSQSISSWAAYPVYFKVGAYHNATNTGNGPTDQSQVIVQSFSATHP